MYKKIKDIVIYADKDYYSAFPAVANLGGGKIIVSFRRAPNYFGLPGIPEKVLCHGDILSQYMCVFSEDNGETWGKPKLIHSPPLGASQDAGLFYDGHFLYAHSFIWRYAPRQVSEKLKEKGLDEYVHHYLEDMVPGGSYVMRSTDKGATWEGPFAPEPLPANKEVMPGIPLTIHNRGNMIKTTEGRLLLTGQELGFKPDFNSSVVIYSSGDEGRTWHYYAKAADCNGEAIFEEPCLHVTPSGKYVMAIRCHRHKGEHFTRAMLFVCESQDEGKTWSEPENTGIHAEPSTSCRLNDGRTLFAYGYRKNPFGVRMRMLDPEFGNISQSEEIIIRSDADSVDVGYPWITRLGDNKFMIAYYMNKTEYKGASRIEGTIFKI